MVFVEMKTLKIDFGLTQCHTMISYLILRSLMPLHFNFNQIKKNNLKDVAVFEMKVFS